MIIQINTDKTLNGDNRHQEYFSSQIKEELERYESHITRVELHLKDENGKKEGVNDKTCVLEARLKGKQPIAVTSQADSIEKAVSLALDKVSAAITTVVGKMEGR
ncbi:MAG: ribosome-associated translation inhibitor RaiA [Pseudoalteromonas distincta]|jgi:ribosome-associated translation inhibitor RaiA